MANQDKQIGDAYTANTVIYRRLSLFENKKYCVLVGVDAAIDHHQLLIFEKSSPLPIIHTSAGPIPLAQVQNRMQELSNETADNPLVIKCTAEALLGLVNILSHPYLLIATKAIEIGQIAGHSVYSVRDTYLHSLAAESNQAQIAANKDHQRVRQLFKSVDVSAGDFYFSYSYDLTHSLQFNSERARKVTGVHNYNDMFAWNFFLAQSLLDVLPSASNWVPALIHGFFSQVANIDVAGLMVTLTLIARRSRRFAGTRYNRRGISKDGFVANHVESELIASHANRQRLYDDRKQTPHCSIVFMRGSIPLFWAQDDPFSPRPEIKITKKEPAFDATVQHLQSLMEAYGAPIICLSLVKRKENVPQETIVGNLFEESIAAILKTGQFPNEFLCFNSFDLLQAKERQAHVVSEIFDLISKLGQQITFFSIADIPHLYTTSNIEISPDSKQTGVVRVNCIDCLDRTNIAQFCLAKFVITQQLVRIGVILNPNANLSDFPDLDQALRDLFVSQGDQIAVQYAGSAAMHKDALKSSAPQDSSAFDIVGNALTAVKRYYSNAITDLDKQFGIAIFLGDIIPETDKPFPGTAQTIPATSDCDDRYDALVKRWTAVFTTKRDIKIARRLLFDDNYNPNQITFFLAIQNPPESPIASSRKRVSLNDLGGKEFFDDTMDLENVPISKPEAKSEPVDEGESTLKNPVSAKLLRLSMRIKPAEHINHLSIVTPRPQKIKDSHIRFYERYIACDPIDVEGEPVESEWRKEIEERLRLLETHDSQRDS